MSDTPKKPIVEHSFSLMDFSEIVENLPSEWDGAALAVGDDTLDRIRPVKRVALHRNASGKWFVVLHATETARASF